MDPTDYSMMGSPQSPADNPINTIRQPTSGPGGEAISPPKASGKDAGSYGFKGHGFQDLRDFVMGGKSGNAPKGVRPMKRRKK